VGDEVLAFAEWKEKGDNSDQDQRLSYEKVTDIFTSHREQRLIHITLETGEKLTATDGHPFKTSEGWRDAILLKKGGKLLLKGAGEEEDAERSEAGERVVTIADVRVEQKIIPVYNLEVANAHTFFVSEDGVLVHNGPRNPLRGVGGVYEFPDALNLGMIYVGKAADLADRLGKWIRRGRCKNIPGVNPMPGSTDLQRRIAEQKRINELGGVGRANTQVSNKINSIDEKDWSKYGIPPPK
jgi:hypothetical protein